MWHEYLCLFIYFAAYALKEIDCLLKKYADINWVFLPISKVVCACGDYLLLELR